MAKKAAKKEASASKTKKTATKTAVKSNGKGSVKPSKVSSKTPKKKVEKFTKAEPKKESKSSIGKTENQKNIKSEGKLKATVGSKLKPALVEEQEISVKKVKAGKSKGNTSVDVVEAPKKEKKIKIDKTGLSEEQINWVELFEKYKGIKAQPYDISAQYEAKTPIQHKLFGWGFVLSNEYDRLEVLFKEGKRMLISNRKLS